MNFFDVVYSRKTVRSFSEDVPSVEDIKRIVDAGRVAPSATNSQPWEFIVIFNQEIKEEMKQAVIDKYEELARDVKEAECAKKITFYKNYSTFFTKAPVVIAVVQKEYTSVIKNILEEKEYSQEEIEEIKPDSALLSMGAAIENMSLAAEALGYGSCWMCAPIIAAKKFKQILNVEEKSKIVSLLIVGKPASDKIHSPNKKALEEVIRIVK